MCGIWTRAKFGSPIDEKDLVFPVRMLAHRGPDSYGWYSDNQVAMVHTRLSIIDLTTGSQPLQSFDKKIIGIVNGELYDYQALRNDLLNQGVSFETRSDSEVLLNLFARQGPKGLAAICGEWAFIFYNSEEQKIYFARDIHGVKPLFYRWTATDFTLASEIKALSDQKPILSETYVKTFIARTMTPPDTALEGCVHVLPGRLYTFDLKNKTLDWQMLQGLPLGQNRNLKGMEAVEATKSALKKAVQKRLVADVEVGCYLSGGIDSALTTAFAVECGAKPKTFTVGFADRDFDERTTAGEISRHLGLEHNVCILTGKNFLDSLVQSIIAFENPITNPHGAAKNLLSAMASQSVKVVLSGEGADEWFGGYAYTRIRKIQEFKNKHPRLGEELLQKFLSQEMGRSMNHLDGQSTINKHIFEEDFLGYQPAVLGRLSKHRFYEYVTGESLNKRLKKISGDFSKYLLEDWPTFASNGSEWDLNVWSSIRGDLLHYILANVGDRQEMCHSLEGRTPFLDLDVINVAAKIHPHKLLQGLNEKAVLKKVALDLLPHSIANRKKHPFFAPIKYFYLREHQEAIEHYVQIAKAETPWLNWTHLDRLLYNKKYSLSSPMEKLRNSCRMLLFSLGVVAKELRTQELGKPRGYKLPEKSQDIQTYRKVFV